MHTVPARRTGFERGTARLGTGTALVNAAMATASAGGTLVVADRIGTAWAAVPATAGILGTAFGSMLIPRLIERSGRRPALVLGYAAGAAGGALAAAVTLGEERGPAVAMLGVTLGLLLLGTANAAGQLSRYVAAELHRPERRAAAIALVVWIATLGAVGGPLLLGPATSVAGGSGGVFVFAALCAGAAAVTASRVPSARPTGTVVTPAAVPMFATPSARSAFAAIAAAQVVMVAVMTAAPAAMHEHGAHATAIGAVLSAHTFGMFALSPVTGVLVAKFGPQRVIRLGLTVLVLASLATVPASDAGQAVPLWALGYGWNLCFVAGSAVLAERAAGGRLAVEGRVDATVWALAAGASLLSTVLLSAGGALLLAGFSGAVVTAAAVVLRAGAAREGTAREGTAPPGRS